jgi:lysozyme
MTDRLAPDDSALIASVKLGEGLRLKAYPDPLTGGSPWTIGYGHTAPDIGPKVCCTADRAEFWLRSDLADALTALDDRLPWWRGLPLEAQRVLAELCFNLGIGGLLGFHHFLHSIQTSRFGDASADLMASLWATQVKSRAWRLASRIAALAPPSATFGADLTRKALEA